MKKQFMTVLVVNALLTACGGESRSYEDLPQHLPLTQSTMTDVSVAQTASAIAINGDEPLAMAENSSATQTQNKPSENLATSDKVVQHAQPTHRPFVITADLTFRTDDVRKTAVAIEQLATQNGGFVVSNQTQSNIVAREKFKQTDGMLLNIERYSTHADLLVRVPHEKAQAFLHGLQPHMTFLEQHNYTAEDIAAKMQREMLAAQRAKDKNKALQQLNQQSRHASHSEREQTIDNQFNARERQDEANIEQAELKDKVDFATISLHFRQPESVMKSVVVDSKALAAQYRPSLWASLQQALVVSGQFFFELLLLVVQTWFIWVGWGVAWVLWRKRHSNKANKKD